MSKQVFFFVNGFRLHWIDSFIVAKDGSAYYALGINSLVTWSITADGNVTLVYSAVERQTIVNLACWDEIDQLVINGEYEFRHYNLTLFSKCACWNGC
jgi:hypothetical protein